MRILNEMILIAAIGALAIGCGADSKGDGPAEEAAGKAASPEAPAPAPSPAPVPTPATSPTDASTTAPYAGSLLVATQASLPACDAARQGALAYAKAEAKFFACEGAAWAAVEIKGEKGDPGAKGDQGATGTAGFTVARYQSMDPGGVDFCTQYTSIESCYFNGGQILRFVDGSLLITGGWTYAASYSAGGDTDTDVDFAAFTFIVSATSSGSWQRLHPSVARGAGYRSVFLTFERASNTFKLIHDTNGDAEPSSTDEVLKTVVVTDD